MEVDTLLTDPGCVGMATAGSLWGRCWVGMGWCGRWQGLYTPGQTQWCLGDTSRTQNRSKVPIEIRVRIKSTGCGFLWGKKTAWSADVLCFLFWVDNDVTLVLPKILLKRRRKPPQREQRRLQHSCQQEYVTTGWPGNRNRWTTGMSRHLFKIKYIKMHVKCDESIYLNKSALV